MNALDLYKEKLVTPEKAVSGVKSGDIIDYGFFNGKPVLCDQALAARAAELRDVSIHGAVTLPPLPEVVQHPDSFIYIDWQWSALTRMLAKGLDNIFYGPILYHNADVIYGIYEGAASGRSWYYNDPEKKGNVSWYSMVRVAPMDDSGYFNLGPQNSETLSKLKRCDTIIVEVVKNMPVCLGGSWESIHISDVDFVVEAPDDHGCFGMTSPEPNDIDIKIAENIIKYIYDGCCIQLGIGAIPNQVGKLIAQSDLKNLGGHTEMLVDAYMDMVEAGQMNGSMKEIDKGKVAYTFAIGSQKLYEHIHKNPAYASYSVDYTNDPRQICKLSNLISICNAVQVDLFSQVNAESMQGSQISGNGGMWDFVIGSQWSKGGKSFICLPSTFKDRDGNVQSRLVSALDPGTITTIPRQMVDYVVTEYGTVKLIGSPTWMRAEKIISLAHPDFREDLIQAAETFKIWRQSNKKA
jgi:acyl-CoA hydrolase